MKIKSVFLIFIFLFLTLNQTHAISCGNVLNVKAFKQIQENEFSSNLAHSLFPQNYEESRTNFLIQVQSLINKLGADRVLLKSFPDPNAQNGETVDIVTILPQKKSKNLVGWTIGTHGIEGYPGAAIAEKYLSEARDLEHTTVSVVHGVMPLAMKYGTRNDPATGIDGNRNGMSTDPVVYNEDYNKQFQELHELIQRGKKTRESLSLDIVRMAIKLGWFLVRNKLQTTFGLNKHPAQPVRVTMGTGQYFEPSGLHYGGTGPHPNIQKITQHFEELAVGHERIVIHDYHTGLGKPGELVIIGSQSVTAEGQALFKTIYGKMYDLVVYTPGVNDDVFYPTPGDFSKSLGERLQLAEPNAQILSVLPEMGGAIKTKGLLNGIKMVSRLYRMLGALKHGFTTDQARKNVQAEFQELFNPPDPEWQMKNLTEGYDVLSLAVKKLEALP